MVSTLLEYLNARTNGDNYFFQSAVPLNASGYKFYRVLSKPALTDTFFRVQPFESPAQQQEMKGAEIFLKPHLEDKVVIA